MNFLFIITDQQRQDHLSCYNDNMVLKTPHIDSIAEDGVKFTNFYCNNPICMPNRSTIYTGQYPSVHGVISNGRNLPQDTRTFVDILRESGYHTASFGKIHLNYFGIPHDKFPDVKESQEFSLAKDYPKLTTHSPYFGLEEVKIVSGHGYICGHPDYLNWVISKVKNDETGALGKSLKVNRDDAEEKLPKKLDFGKGQNLLKLTRIAKSKLKLQVAAHRIREELYSTTYVKENTIDFLKRFAEGKVSKKNFFTFCSFPDPHHPYTPPGKYFDMYKPEDVVLSPSFNDTHEKSPEFMKTHYNETMNTDGTTKGLFPNPKDVTELDAKRVIAASYGMEKMIDDAVGEILKVLEDTGLAENTVVIYTTDHGELGGDHRFFFKGPYLYRALAKIPFLMKVPGGLKNRASKSLASSIDIPETILELVGLDIPSSMQGKSLIPILNNPNTELHEEVLIEMDDEIMDETSRTLMTKEWRITVFGTEDEGELYDLKEDPEEMNNLWHDSSFIDKKLELTIKLLNKGILTDKKPSETDLSFNLKLIREEMASYESPIHRDVQF